VRSEFDDRRDYDVLVQSPRLFEKTNDQKGALKKQLKEAMPTELNSGLSDEERFLNSRLQGILSPERIDGVIEQVHHKNALSLVGEALDRADDEGKERIYRLFDERGISLGNEALNLINMDKESHKILHKFAREKGWEMQAKGSKGLALGIMNASNIDETIGYLEQYADEAVPTFTALQDELIGHTEGRKKAKNLVYQYTKLKR
tara:strand:+ start:191 stop:802 length:612 start_codon:yes stop_codon:yes gene_type:complete